MSFSFGGFGNGGNLWLVHSFHRQEPMPIRALQLATHGVVFERARVDNVYPGLALWAVDHFKHAYSRPFQIVIPLTASHAALKLIFVVLCSGRVVTNQVVTNTYAPNASAKATITGHKKPSKSTAMS
jgi:hypothetical protein